MSAPSSYTAPRQGCAYEEEKELYELFSAARILDLRCRRLRHLLGEDTYLLDEGEDEACGPIVLEIPRKYLIEVLPERYPVPTAAQLAVPAPVPTLDDRLRRAFRGT